MTPQNVNPPARAPRRWDVLLVGSLVILGLGLVLAERPLGPGSGWTAVRVLALLPLPWRRRYPIAMIGLGFGVASVGALGQLASQGVAEPPDVTAALLLFPHALGRWTTGRKLGLGIGLAAALVSVSLVAEGLTPAEMAGAAGVLATPLAIGISNRLRDEIRTQALKQVQLDERHRLGRQLDDVVAHRLVAIVIQAQTAARDRSARAKEAEPGPPEDPSRALQALETIEREASQCLTEMRELVRHLRHGEDERAPHTARRRRDSQDSLPMPADRDTESS